MTDVCRLPDFYFTPDYGALNATLEGGTLETFVHNTPIGTAYHMFIRLPLPDDIGGTGYSDIITPYGYGGPLLLDCADAHRAELAASYAAAFAVYCRDRKTVSEFVRFHPLLANAADWIAHMDVEFARHTVYIDLTVPDIVAQYHRKQRRILKMPSDVAIEFDFTLQTIDAFAEMYAEFLAFRGAQSYYFFPRSYFDALANCIPHCFLVHARRNGQIVSSRLILRYGKWLHDHLAFTRPGCYDANGSSLLINAVADWGKQNGFTRFHLGGGMSAARDDSLFIYKREFSRCPYLDYYLGKKIHDPDMFDTLCRSADERREHRITDGFFPPYRAR